MKTSLVLLIVVIAVASCSPSPKSASTPTVRGPSSEGGAPAAPSSSAAARPSLDVEACGPLTDNPPPDLPPRQMLQRLPTSGISGFDISASGQLAIVSDSGESFVWDLASRTLVKVLRRKVRWLQRFERAAWDVGGESLRVQSFDGAQTLGLDARETTAESKLLLPADFPRKDMVPRTWGTVVSHAGDFAFVDRAIFDRAARGRLLFWPRGHMSELPRILAPTLDVDHAEFIGDGDAMLVSVAVQTATRRRTEVYLWDTRSPALPANPVFSHEGDVGNRDATWSLRAVSRDGKLAAFGDWNRLHVVDLKVGKELWDVLAPFEPGADPHRIRGAFGFATFSPDGKTLAALTPNGIGIYDIARGRLQATLGARVPKHTEVAFADDDTLVVRSEPAESKSGTDEDVAAWSLAGPHHTKNERRGWMPAVARDASLGLLAAETSLVEGGPCGTEPVTFVRPLVVPGRGTYTRPSARALSRGWPPSSASPVAICGYSSVGAIDAARGRVVGTLTGAAEEVAVEDLRTGKRVKLAASRDVVVTDRDLSPDGRFLYVKKDAQSAMLWSTDTGARLFTDVRARISEVVAEAKGTPRYVGSASWSPSSALLAVPFAEDRIAILSMPKLTRAGVVTLPAAIDDYVFLPNDTLAISTVDGSLTLVRGGVITSVGKSSAGGQSLAVSPSGKLVAGRGDDEMVRIWDVATATVRAALVDFADGDTLALTPGGAYAGTTEAARRMGFVFDKPTEGFQFERFAAKYRRPELVGKRLAGVPEDLALDLRRPPRIALAGAPEPVAADPLQMRVRVHVESSSRVDAVRAFVEGRPVAAARVCRPSGEATIDVPVRPGLNRIGVVAFDAAGTASNTMTFDAEGASAREGERPDIWIVAAGISKYPQLPKAAQLDAAALDARSIVTAFAAQASGANALYARAHERLLVDEQVTPASVANALDELEAMRPGDVAVVFFAGHGAKPSVTEDMVFLSSATAATEESLRTTGIGWPLVGEHLRKARGRVLVVLDACHAGHVSQEIVVPNDCIASSLVSEGRAGAVIFAASQGAQLSYESGTSRGLVLSANSPDAARVGVRANASPHGFFTGALVEALASAATDRDGDGAIDLSELVDEVTGRVAYASSGLQTPWVARRELFGDFRVARLRSATPPSSPPSPSPPRVP